MDQKMFRLTAIVFILFSSLSVSAEQRANFPGGHIARLSNCSVTRNEIQVDIQWKPGIKLNDYIIFSTININENDLPSFFDLVTSIEDDFGMALYDSKTGKNARTIMWKNIKPQSKTQSVRFKIDWDFEGTGIVYAGIYKKLPNDSFIPASNYISSETVSFQKEQTEAASHVSQRKMEEEQMQSTTEKPNSGLSNTYADKVPVFKPLRPMIPLSKTDSKIERLTALLNRDKKNIDALYERGLLYTSKKDLNKALADFNKAIDLDQFRQREVTQALDLDIKTQIKELSNIISAERNNWVALYNRGVFFASEGDLESALLDYNKAIELNDDDASAYYNRALLYVKMSKLDEAIRDYTKSIALDSKYADAYCNRGNAYFEKKEISHAIEDYNAALKINANDNVVYYNLARAYFEIDDIDNVIKNLHNSAKAAKEASNSNKKTRGDGLGDYDDDAYREIVYAIIKDGKISTTKKSVMAEMRKHRTICSDILPFFAAATNHDDDNELIDKARNFPLIFRRIIKTLNRIDREAEGAEKELTRQLIEKFSLVRNKLHT